VLQAETWRTVVPHLAVTFMQHDLIDGYRLYVHQVEQTLG
jgi:hypothetical protein